MSAPRTPGPWAYLDIGEIVSCDPVDDMPTDDVVCVVAGPEHPNADGTLLAAAPHLYAALWEIADALANPVRPGHVAYKSKADLIAIAKRALERAGGGL